MNVAVSNTGNATDYIYLVFFFFLFCLSIIVFRSFKKQVWKGIVGAISLIDYTQENLSLKKIWTGFPTEGLQYINVPYVIIYQS